MSVSCHLYDLAALSPGERAPGTSWREECGDPEIWSCCPEDRKNFFSLHGIELQLFFEANVDMCQYCWATFCHYQYRCIIVPSERWKSTARQLLVILMERLCYYWPLSAVDLNHVVNRLLAVTVCKFLKTYLLQSNELSVKFWRHIQAVGFSRWIKSIM
jgi:hypothetical protein